MMLLRVKKHRSRPSGEVLQLKKKVAFHTDGVVAGTIFPEWVSLGELL
jgi:hypothetical protein